MSERGSRKARTSKKEKKRTDGGTRLTRIGEQEEQASSLYARSLIEASLDPLVTISAEGKITDVNKATEEVTGFSREQLIGTDFSNYFIDPEEARRGYRHVFAEGFVRDYPLAIRHKSGKITDVLYNATVYRNEAGETQGVFAAARDITERKKAEEALRKAHEELETRVEERTKDLTRAAKELEAEVIERREVEENLRQTRDYLENLLNYANAPIICWDAEFKITRFNHAFEHLTGYRAEEVIGRDLSLLFPEKSKEESLIRIKHTLTERWEVVEIPIQRREGDVRVILWNSANVYATDGKTLMATIAQGQDITDRKEMQAKLEEYSKHLERLVEEKTRKLQEVERMATIGETAGMVGHDIRNPLQSIEGAVYLAKEELKSVPTESEEKKELSEILGIIENQTSYIDHIVADLQDFARTPKLQLRETDMQTLITEALAVIGIPENIEIQTIFQEDNEQIVADPTCIKRVLINLIENAVQALPNGGKIAIRTCYEPDTVCISVEDTGSGISEEHKPRIFTPLFTTKAKGQGFGLSVCKKLVDAHGGEITFESEAGKGTTFKMKLPRTPKVS